MESAWSESGGGEEEAGLAGGGGKVEVLGAAVVDEEKVEGGKGAGHARLRSMGGLGGEGSGDGETSGLRWFVKLKGVMGIGRIRWMASGFEISNKESACGVRGPGYERIV